MMRIKSLFKIKIFFYCSALPIILRLSSVQYSQTNGVIAIIRVILTILFLATASLPQVAQATPTLALKEANNCAACHTPGRSQRPVLWRRCTLDCQGCHVDPNGAGPRNQWGYYYTHDQLNAVNFFKPIDPLKDTSRYDLHYDGRVIQRQTDRESRQFPMASEVTARVRPFINWLHISYTALFLGRIGDESLRQGQRRYEQKYAVMVDALPMNTYVRAARGTPVYGLRRPNHSLWIRERIGLDQFALVESVTAGGTPNVPYWHLSYMTGDPRQPKEDRQKGYSAHSGLRGVTLGWHINGSYWQTESQKSKIKMQALGLGANLFQVIIYGERNFRWVEEKEVTLSEALDFDSQAIRTHPTSTINDLKVAYAGLPGVIFGSHYETLNDPQHDSKRISYFIDLHPFPYVQFELWRRFESGTRSLADTLFVAHLYADL